MAENVSDPRSFIERLAASQPHEVDHALHVTGMALRLFDALRGRMDWTGNDRLILEAAARLHDIGYADDPADHARAGAHRVMRTKPSGFAPADLRRVMAVMLLHSSRPGGESLLPIPPELMRDRVVQQLGALLRVADGLDHSHLQDTCITRVALGEDEARVFLTTAPFTNNAEQATLKADLWAHVLPFKLALVSKPRPDYVLVRPTEDVGLALRRILVTHERTLSQAIRRTAAEDSEESLHDLRVALRSLRRLLNAFARPLRKTSAAAVEKKLAQLTDQIAPARDLDVGQIILNKRRVVQVMSKLEGWDRFLFRQKRLRDKARTDLRGLMASPATRKIRNQLRYLLRVELPQKARSKRPFVEEAERCMAKAWRGAIVRRKLAGSKDADKLHDLRIAIRRYRLLAELLTPALGRAVYREARRIRPLERKLGRLHDLDVARERYKKLDDPIAKPLADLLFDLRKRQRLRFRAAWRTIRLK